MVGMCLREMRMLQTTLKSVEAAEALLVDIRNELAELRSKRKILCICGKSHEIRKLNLVVTHWYHEPNSCIEGDYWSEGEWRFACPVNGALNRILFDDYSVDYAQRQTVGVAAEPTFKSIYRNLFASCKDTHEHQDPPAYNNYDVDRHRKRFELPESGGCS